MMRRCPRLEKKKNMVESQSLRGPGLDPELFLLLFETIKKENLLFIDCVLSCPR